jgi:hypothetical protein
MQPGAEMKCQESEKDQEDLPFKTAILNDNHPPIKPIPPNGVQTPNAMGMAMPFVINVDIIYNEPLNNKMPAIKKEPALFIHDPGYLSLRIPVANNANTW